MTGNENSFSARLLAALRSIDPATAPPSIRIEFQTSPGTPYDALEVTAAGVAAAITALENDATSTRLRPVMDPLLLVQIEDHFANVGPEAYLDDVFNSPDADASLAAYEQLVTGEWDGDL
ncbi:hypothetical protein [Streptomyces sp. NPDC001274]